MTHVIWLFLPLSRALPTRQTKTVSVTNPQLLHAVLASLSEILTGRRLSGSFWLSLRSHLLQIIGSLPGQSPRNPSLQAWFLLLAQGGRAQSTLLTRPWPECGLHVPTPWFIFFQNLWLGVCTSLPSYISNGYSQMTGSFLYLFLKAQRIAVFDSGRKLE